MRFSRETTLMRDDESDSFTVQTSFHHLRVSEGSERVRGESFVLVDLQLCLPKHLVESDVSGISTKILVSARRLEPRMSRTYVTFAGKDEFGVDTFPR